MTAAAPLTIASAAPAIAPVPGEDAAEARGPRLTVQLPVVF
ncbi:MAG TPA: hypothetical protein VK391_06085 [Allosphingosinicella sp.]|nr:hypothetical protein [Allosphingosinicella sp.]